VITNEASPGVVTPLVSQPRTRRRSQYRSILPMARGWFRVGTDRLGPERLRFDTITEGRARRAWLSGWEYYRTSDEGGRCARVKSSEPGIDPRSGSMGPP